MRPFDAEEYSRRMTRAAEQATEAGLTGVLVTPGPDLIYFTGYAPVAITERITMLAIQSFRQPAIIVPNLERPDAEDAPAAAAISLCDWADGSDPYKATAELLDPRGCYAISDSAWAMHVLGLQRTLPESSYVSMTRALPMLRAIKNPEEIERLAAAGAAADASLEEIVQVRFAGRAETEMGADLTDLLRKHGHSQVDFTVVGSGPTGPTPTTSSVSARSRTATWSSLTSAASRRATDRTPRAPSMSASRARRSAGSSRWSATPSRRASRQCDPESHARRSTAPPAR
jgi:Xaa-Pro aminopeptidase